MSCDKFDHPRNCCLQVHYYLYCHYYYSTTTYWISCSLKIISYEFMGRIVRHCIERINCLANWMDLKGERESVGGREK